MKMFCINNNSTLSREVLNCLEMLIDDSKLSRIKKYRNSKDYENALVADVLARYAILKSAKVKYIKKPFLLSDYGKPYLPEYIKLQFNISHSGDWIACAIDEKAIGIDVEFMNEIDILEIARDFFSTEEYALILSVENGVRKMLFYDIWTLKESYIKALGKGLSIKLDSFSIIKANNSIQYKTQILHEQCHFKQYDIDENYKLSVCSFNDDFPSDVTYIDINDFYKSLTY